VVSATLPARQLPSIGRPISNTRLYVLDDHLQVVPAGVYGELYIGGLGVARGYLHQPGLTADRFIPDPFSGECGSRLYRTGDVARYLPDGRLAFGGRRDHQVQVRGFRVELGEIEAVLTNHPDIDQCVVLAKPTAAAGDSKLIAYLVPSPVLDKFETLIPMIRPYLAERLPAYMWPADYILVDTLPLTENGKVDHAALLNLESPHPTAQTRLMPDNHVERQIAAIWQEVLSKEQISSQDNFFDLGGHSLLLVQIQDQLEQNFGRSIPLTTLFNHPTIASLARYLRDEETEEIDPIDHQQISRRVAARQTAQQQRARRQSSHPFPVKKEA
jgi:acyl carrier protein